MTRELLRPNQVVTEHVFSSCFLQSIDTITRTILLLQHQGQVQGLRLKE
jgi:hypothetical protein